MVTCGQKLIPVKVEEVFVNIDGTPLQLTEADRNLYNGEVTCGRYIQGYITKPVDHYVYGYLLCRQCAMKVGFIW